MKRQLLLLAFACLMNLPSYGTHNRAGEIIYELIGPLTYRVSIYTYTKESSIQADRDSLELDWGDGIVEVLPRTNGPMQGGNHIGETLGNDIKENIYVGEHTYGGAQNMFILSVSDPNRIANIININQGNSVNVLFYIEDTIFMYPPASLGYNNSPILLNKPIDFANRLDTFFHNPNAHDPDDDSLHFSLIKPLQAHGIPVPNYQYPDEISPGPDNKFNIDPRTGELEWAVPQEVGIYNIAILIREYRGDAAIHMGSMIRDMQIIVYDEPNDPPRICNIKDTCIIAGSTFIDSICALDPDGHSVTLTAAGGPFEVSNSPAQFTSFGSGANVTGVFEWSTECSHIRKQFYQVVFKAEDNYVSPGGLSIPLVDLETWLINVVAPPPEDVVAQAVGNEILVAWNDQYPCDNTNRFVGFSVWRREGSNPFIPDACEIGLAGRGYSKIVDRLTGFSYLDSDVQQGKKYCYRVLAEFASIVTQSGAFYNLVESIPSNEGCSELRRDVPIITNVSVDVTDLANGEIYVAWSKPLTDTSGLDTVLFPGPYVFEVNRVGAAGNPIATSTSPTFYGLNDTTYTDAGLNTDQTQYNYFVEFFAETSTRIGETETASSIYLDIAATDNQLDLSWNETVPWTNLDYVIFRKDPGSSVFDSIGITSVNEYSDTDLINDSTYCYYVKSIGSYSAPGLIDPIINFSQEMCAIPIDTIAPCQPTLTVTNYCDQITGDDNCSLIIEENDFINELVWNNPNNSCADDVAGYRIYYSSPLEDDFELIATMGRSTDTTYTHVLENSLAGCYIVTAIDSNENESSADDIVCVDNCPCYILPNVFTPNGDGANDLFTPILPYRFIDHVEMQIFNRWGNQVFETTDPDLNWNGTDMKSGKALNDGVYYYTCAVQELRVDGVQPRSEVLKGYIHLIIGKSK